MNGQDKLALTAVALCWLGLATFTWLLFKCRRPDLGARPFMLGSPLWFVTPRRYFREDRAVFVWRGFFLWVAGTLVVSALAESSSVWFPELTR